MAKLLTVLGLLATSIYCGAIYWLTYGKLANLLDMPLNEVGDFLAGVFGPVAIFWLILGFIQQGKELQQSTAALHLQASELKESVQQQRNLFEFTKERADDEKERAKQQWMAEVARAQPSFVVRSVSLRGKPNQGCIYKAIIKNTGELAKYVKISSKPELPTLTPDKLSDWGHNMDYPIEWEFSKGDNPELVSIRFSYVDLFGNRNFQYLTFKCSEGEILPYSVSTGTNSIGQ